MFFRQWSLLKLVASKFVMKRVSIIGGVFLGSVDLFADLIEDILRMLDFLLLASSELLLFLFAHMMGNVFLSIWLGLLISLLSLFVDDFSYFDKLLQKLVDLLLFRLNIVALLFRRFHVYGAILLILRLSALVGFGFVVSGMRVSNRFIYFCPSLMTIEVGGVIFLFLKIGLLKRTLVLLLIILIMIESIVAVLGLKVDDFKVFILDLIPIEDVLNQELPK